MYTFSPKTKIESAKVNSNFSECATPVGSITAFAGSSAPTGWLLADGSAVSRTTYADLFAILGTTYGAGDGSTTFALPDLKGKAVVGFDSTQTEFDALGETGGEKTHLLTSSESGLKAHTHALSPIALSGTTSGSVVGSVIRDNGSTINQLSNTAAANTASNAAAAHNNLQPYITLNYIIKH